VSEETAPFVRNRRMLERFNFTSIREIGDLKKRVDENPDLRDRLKENFFGTLQDEGIDVDEVKHRVVQIWRDQMGADLRQRMSELPEEKKKYYMRISEGKPLKLRVRINQETGEKTVQLREDP
jgi:hypothetical protein